MLEKADGVEFAGHFVSVAIEAGKQHSVVVSQPVCVLVRLPGILAVTNDNFGVLDGLKGDLGDAVASRDYAHVSHLVVLGNVENFTLAHQVATVRVAPTKAVDVVVVVVSVGMASGGQLAV